MKISLHNWSIHPCWFDMDKSIWKKWFSIERKFSGKIIYVCFKHWMIQIDLR